MPLQKLRGVAIFVSLQECGFSRLQLTLQSNATKLGLRSTSSNVNIKEIITVWWNDAYLSTAFLRGGARTSQNSSMKVAQQNNFQGPGLHYVSQTLFWLVTQQRKNKRNYNLRSSARFYCNNSG